MITIINQLVNYYQVYKLLIYQQLIIYLAIQSRFKKLPVPKGYLSVMALDVRLQPPLMIPMWIYNIQQSWFYKLHTVTTVCLCTPGNDELLGDGGVS